MAERKEVFDRLADVFVALPGGFGTLDEMTEMLTWNQIGVHSKLLGVLNTAGFYDGWLLWIGRALQDGFIKQAHLDNMIVETTAEALVEKLLSRKASILGSNLFTRA